MLNFLKSWINKEPENTDILLKHFGYTGEVFVILLEHFGYKGKVFDIVFRERKSNEFFSFITVEAFDKYSKILIARRNLYTISDLKFEIKCLKEVLKNTMITSEDIYK